MSMSLQPKNDSYDPQTVRITDLLNEEQIMEIVRAFRMGGKAAAGVFVKHESDVVHIDNLYGNIAPESPPGVLAVAQRIMRNGEPQQSRCPDGSMIIGHPIRLHFDGKSYLKGCFVGVPPEMPASEPEACAVVVKVVAEMFSDRMSAAYLSRMAARDYEILAEKRKIADSPITSLIDRVNTAFVLVDRDMVLRWHNAALAKRTGKSDMTGKLCYSGVFGRDSMCPGCLVERTFKTGEQQTGDISIQTEEWGVRHFSITTAPVCDENGEVKYALELAYDMTDAHEAESKLARYKRLLDNSADLMVVCNSNLHILASNRRFIERCGYEEQEVIGRCVLDMVLPEEHEELLADAGMLRETGMAIGVIHLIKKDGSLIPTQVFATYDGDTGVYEAVFRDISERRRLEQEIRVRSQELEAQNTKVLAAIEEKDRFFRNVSHELRTPLTSIIGFAELLSEDTVEPLSERQMMQLSRVIGNSHKLLAMVNDLLDLSRLDAGRMRMEWANLDLAKFLEHIVNNMMPLARNKNLPVSVSIPKRLPVVMTDEHKLGQIVVNLLSNAIKFTRQGSVSLSVTKSGESVLISVSDTGTGIPEDEFDEIFKEFSRGSLVESKNVGTGLGLAISRKLADVLGGEIAVQSKVGEGSTFSLKLPIVPAKVTDPGAGVLEPGCNV
ncbi:MAG: PAS domain-containing sensor histidine kinase [Armatimonadota bacterium]